MRNSILLAILLLHVAHCHLNVWPLPRQFTKGDATVAVAPDLEFVDASSHQGSELLTKVIARYQNLIKKTIWTSEYRNEDKSTHSGTVIKKVNLVVDDISEKLGAGLNESYVLIVPSDQDTIDIKTPTIFGAMRALETLHQIVELQDDESRVIHYAPLHIQDSPAFTHRGILLDTSRNYFPVSDILRTLDGMSMNKLNVFHWHIVDSQSFPLRSNAVPELAEKGAYRKKGKALVYTDEDIKHIVQYGLERGIRVIPELDMPGHTRSWAYAYPDISTCIGTSWTKNAAEPPAGQLNPIDPETYKLLDKLLSDISPWFSDPYWHAGGDEVKFSCWNESTAVTSWMADHNIQDWNQLVQLFAGKLYGILGKLGKTPMLWEEMVLDFDVKAPTGSVVQAWRGVSAVKELTTRGYQTVVSSNEYWYLDCGHGSFVDGGKSWCDPFKSWQVVYSFDILENLTETQQSLVLGGEICLWAEQVDPTNMDVRLWPRSASAAEVMWSGKDAKGAKRSPLEAMPRFWDMRLRLVDAGINAEPLQPLYCAQNDCNF